MNSVNLQTAAAFLAGSVPAGSFHSSDLVELKKDELNLLPALNFVEKHIGAYEHAWRAFNQRVPRAEYKAAQPLIVNSTHLLPARPQIAPEDVPSIVSRLPEPILELSMLESVDYSYANTVPLPVYEEDGTWQDFEFVDADDFPRAQDHPGRILIGRSTGKTIYPSALPDSMHANTRVKWFYQLHVFLHEMFHTLEYLRRTDEKRLEIVLVNSDGQFTLRQWVTLWEQQFLPARRCRFPTRYASNYGHKLTLEKFRDEPLVFTHALAEQMCESFVGYVLGIVPNYEGKPVFKEHSPELWNLMDMLATSHVVKK